MKNVYHQADRGLGDAALQKPAANYITNCIAGHAILLTFCFITCCLSDGNRSSDIITMPGCHHSMTNHEL